jgi:hypothetical protein
MLAFGLVGCSMLAFTPMGCGGVVDDYSRAPISERGLKLPESTVARLQACADEYAPKLPSSSYKLSFDVAVDALGGVVEVKTVDMQPFNRDVDVCMILALRAMSVPASVLPKGDAPLVSENTQTPASRGTLGTVFIPIAVIAVAEIMLEAGAVTFLFAITLRLADAIARRSWKDECAEEYTKCMDTAVSGEDGNHIKQTRCAACVARCRIDQSWPSEVGNGSCEYRKRDWLRRDIQ